MIAPQLRTRPAARERDTHKSLVYCFTLIDGNHTILCIRLCHLGLRIMGNYSMKRLKNSNRNPAMLPPSMSVEHGMGFNDS